MTRWFPIAAFLVIACTASPTAPSDGPSSVTLSVWQSELEVGASIQLTVEVRDRDDSLVSGPALTWSTDLPAVATVNATGQLHGVSVGTVRVTVRTGGLSATRTVIIRRVRLYTLTLAGTSDSVRVGGKIRLNAVLRSDDGVQVQYPPLIWSVEPAQAAQINGVGELLGVAPGVVTITVSSDAYRATRVITVLPAIPAVIGVTGQTRMLRTGGTSQLWAEVKSTDFAPMPTALVAWSSSDPSVFAVSAGGLVTAVGIGQATMTAIAGGASTRRTVTVIGVPPLLHQLTFLRTTGNESHIEVTTETGTLLATIQPSIALSAHLPDGDPTVSMAPDGNTIAYDCIPGVCQLKLTGGGVASPYPLSGVSLPSWNGDGSVLLLREGASSIVQYGWERNSKVSRQVPQPVDRSRISPDGLSVLYECNIYGGNDFSDGALCLLSAEGNTSIYQSYANAVSWSPWDGTLAYVLMDPWEGTEVLVIEPLPDPSGSNSGSGTWSYGNWPSFADFSGVTETAWSPDGQRLAVVRNGELWLFSISRVLALADPVRIAHVDGSRISSISWR